MTVVGSSEFGSSAKGPSRKTRASSSTPPCRRTSPGSSQGARSRPARARSTPSPPEAAGNIGLEYVLGRPVHHVACIRELWIDVETPRPAKPRTGAGRRAQPIEGAFRTIEVTELEFGEQPVGLFDLSRPDDVANITPEQECARDPLCSATPIPAFTPMPDATPATYPPRPPNLASNGWVAYVMQPGISGDGPADIYLVREGVAPRLIVGGDYEHGHNGCPTFSPDGSRLAYAEALKRDSNGMWSGLAVVVIQVDDDGTRVGPEIRIPVPGPSDLPCPKWSPDGERVAYGFMGDMGFAGLAVTNVVEDSTIVLASDDSEGRVAGRWIANWGPFAWSPAGDVLAVSEGAGGIWLVPTDGGEPRLLRDGNFREPAWSPDGSRIAGTSCPSSCERDVVSVLRVDGTAADLELGPGEHPVWSPNGDRLAYVATVEVSAGSCGADRCRHRRRRRRCAFAPLRVGHPGRRAVGSCLGRPLVTGWAPAPLYRLHDDPDVRVFPGIDLRGRRRSPGGPRTTNHGPVRRA